MAACTACICQKRVRYVSVHLQLWKRVFYSICQGNVAVHLVLWIDHHHLQRRAANTSTGTNNVPHHIAQLQGAQGLRLCTATVAGKLCGCLWCCALQLLPTSRRRAAAPGLCTDSNTIIISEHAYSMAQMQACLCWGWLIQRIGSGKSPDRLNHSCDAWQAWCGCRDST